MGRSLPEEQPSTVNLTVACKAAAECGINFTKSDNSAMDFGIGIG